MAFKILSWILFFTKLFTVVPYKVITKYRKLQSTDSSFTHVGRNKIWLRLFMREATSICDYNTLKYVLNPLFDWICKLVLCVSSVPTTSDRILLSSSSSSLDYPNPQSDYYWYYVPPNYIPKRDNTLIFVHGGGFAIKMIPLEFLFLNNLISLFPEMAIIIHDYTVSTENGGRLPKQCDELKELYIYLTTVVGCKNVILLGESAGGHVILNLLLQLQEDGLNLPKKVICVSPWCNPFQVPLVDEKGPNESGNYKKLDSLTKDHLMLFSTLLLKQSIRVEEDNMDIARMLSEKSKKNRISMDLEVDFHEEYWTKIVEQVSIYVSYGTHETLKGEITRLCDKLMKVSNSNGNVTVFEDHEGSHIEPLLHIGIRDPIKWSHFPNVEPIIEFLED